MDGRQNSFGMVFFAVKNDIYEHGFHMFFCGNCFDRASTHIVININN